MKILLIEDEKVLSHALNYFLTKNDFEVTLVDNGKDAIEKFNNINFDLIITDLMLPYITGYELISLFKDKKIIVLSSLNNEDTIVKCFEMGTYEYIVKPVNWRELLIRIKKLIK